MEYYKTGWIFKWLTMYWYCLQRYSVTLTSLLVHILRLASAILEGFSMEEEMTERTFVDNMIE